MSTKKVPGVSYRLMPENPCFDLWILINLFILMLWHHRSYRLITIRKDGNLKTNNAGKGLEQRYFRD